MKPGTWTAWGILWRSKNRLDGKRENLEGAAWRTAPPELRGCTGSMMFCTRHACREFIEKHWGYIRDREDLRAEPFGWKMPKAVKISVQVKVKEKPQ